MFKEKGIGEKLLAWVREVWEWIGSRLGIRGLAPEQIQNLTLEQFVDGAVADILSGKPVEGLPFGVSKRLRDKKTDVHGPAKRDSYDFDVSGITEANAQEMKRIKDVAVKSGTFMKAPNGKATKLNERQWLQVRTKAFKKWFGDWEVANKLALIEDMAATEIKPHSLTGGQLFEVYKSLANGKNKFDNREVRFVNNTFGKIIRHRGVDSRQLIPLLKDVFDNSVPLYSEAEQVKEGHKKHTNFKGYSHYLGKITLNKKEYYVRFTVQELDAKPKTLRDGFVPDEMHSTFISDVDIYEKPIDTPVNSQIISRATTEPVNGLPDAKLQQFFENAREARENSSKVVDENGEPMVVYHGTNADFTVFDKSKVGQNFKADNNGFFFSSEKGDIKFPYYGGIGYAQNAVEKNGGKATVIAAFVNLTNPKIIKGNSDGAGIISLIEGLDSGYIYDNGAYRPTGKNRNIEDATDNGNDGVLVIDEYDTPNESIVVAFNPSQIKSATNNNGDFDEKNDDIRHHFIGEKGAGNLDKTDISIKNETARLDYIDRYEAGSELRKTLGNAGYRAKFTAHNTVILFHGSSSENISKIRKAGLSEQSFLASSKKEVDKHVSAKRKNNEIIEIQVDPRDIDFSTGTNEYYAPDGLAPGMDGVWASPKRIEAMRKKMEATTRMDNLGVARKMETSGKDAKSIKMATGWERGADGEWRYEIPDTRVETDMLDKERGTFAGKLADILNGQELFSAYPGLRNSEVYIAPRPL
ncbi:MAG: hypothetical protein LBH61_06350, partial [Dysgonamonadaceae bacterium]|nr:hypothetical protein [Dysgonamonadaceae bacterium]